MRKSDWRAVIEVTTAAAIDWFESLPHRRVYRPAEPDEIRAVVGRPLPEEGMPPAEAVAELARAVEPFTTAFASGRFFGFVIGGLHPAAYGADLLAAAWDQNAGLYGGAPGVTVVEEVAAGWLLDLLHLPPESSVGLVTGGQMANFTCLAAARDAVLRAAGWDVEADGLHGAPPINVIVKPGTHDTIGRALRFLGLGQRRVTTLAGDGEARMDVNGLAGALARTTGPTIVCLDAGNINTGSFDDYHRVADLAEAHRARGNPTWVHVDGAIGLWARASRRLRHLTDGLERLDSWSTDAHKLLNVGFDCGIAMCRDRAAHNAAMSIHSSYLLHNEPETVRDPMDYNPEYSRRARGLPVYAVLSSLGREGVEEMVDRMCELARRFEGRLRDSGAAQVLNDVVFNQVLVRWHAPDGDDDAFTERLLDRVRAEGAAFFSGTTLAGQRLMRISVADWASDESDVDGAIEALLRAARQG